jgi:hypothetical protein
LSTSDNLWIVRLLVMALLLVSAASATRVSWLKAGVPHVWLVRLSDPALFECPYLMASDVGTIGLAEEEVKALSLYLKKGGFLWVDDFWGEERGSNGRASWGAPCPRLSTRSKMSRSAIPFSAQ